MYEIPVTHRPGMRVPVRIFADGALLEQIRGDRSIEQLCNVAMLPGIVGAALGMPDMHEGYGFPVGGVAATLLPDGVISPGGIGFDINCGVRLLTTTLRIGDVRPVLEPLVHELSRSIPSGFGRARRDLTFSAGDLDALMREGAPWLLRNRGIGEEADLERIESGGCLPGADPGEVSARAHDRGHAQIGTLGGGNHFLEVQVVEAVEDPATAAVFGLREGAITLSIHTGSRGLGHQVCSDHVRVMDEAMTRLGIVLPDRQLACAPLSSPEGQAYLAAMSAAANFAFCNRQAIAHVVRAVFRRVLGESGSLRLVYDVGHNTGKVEEHGGRKLCVHRKGATRALGPGHPELPAAYRETGQPVLIPGSMGTASWVLAGTDRAEALTLSSTCHGAGRRMSRGRAKHEFPGHVLRKELAARGIVVRCPSNPELAEEAPGAYKDVDRVVDVVHREGIARKVARLRPIGVVKG